MAGCLRYCYVDFTEQNPNENHGEDSCSSQTQPLAESCGAFSGQVGHDHQPTHSFIMHLYKMLLPLEMMFPFVWCQR